MMKQEELKEIFNQKAAGYDKNAGKNEPIYDALYLLLEAVLFGLPGEAHILCVGAGTGAELVYLAQKFPQWRFTAVDPAEKMLEVCRKKTEELGIIERCDFHEGYVETLPGKSNYDAATCFLVSQFILDQKARSDFFRNITQKLKPGGILASADLAAEVNSTAYEELLKDWLNLRTSAQKVTQKSLDQMRATYDKHVSILPPETVASVIESGGFETPVEFFQAGLVHAWHAKKGSNSVE